MKKTTVEMMRQELESLCEKAKLAGRVLATMSGGAKRDCLLNMADELERESAAIIGENRKDLKAGAEKGLSKPMLDRLKLDAKVIESMADGLRTVASQEDPVGKVLSSTLRPNGLRIDKVSVSIGVIGIIYESRPNVTSDAAGICLAAGNACVLRGGSEAFYSNMAIAKALNRACVMSGLPDGAIQLVPWTDREAVNMMLKMDRYIDLIIPRGGENLIRMVVENSTIPVIKHYKGVCHLYVDESADLEMALRILVNAKCQRPSACNAVETLLVHRSAADKFMPMVIAEMKKNKVLLRGNQAVRKYDEKYIEFADENDYSIEYLDYILAVKIVEDVKSAVEHINYYGSKHSDGIVAASADAVNYFFANVDSAALYHNASTRFTDGGEFGMGAEIGISTDKLHARGPMGANELTSYKFLVFGSGQVR